MTSINLNAQDAYLGDIKMTAVTFNQRGWMSCEGQLLQISSNTALFSLLGTTYGGDGRTTFALPDLRGRAPIHAGNGPGLSSRRLGSKGGSESNTLNTTQIPSHSHSAAGKLKINSGAASSPDATNNFPALANGRTSSGDSIQIADWSPTSNASGASNGVEVTVGNTGGNQSVNNMQPWLAVNYIIALQGYFPSRS